MFSEPTLLADFDLGFKFLGVSTGSYRIAAARENVGSGEDEGSGVKASRDCFFEMEFRVWGIFAGYMLELVNRDKI